ncbi:MAG: hypothetical protein ACLTFB_01040 [Candidatus Phytoplasma pyri]
MSELEIKIDVLIKKLKIAYDWLLYLTIVVVILSISQFFVGYKMKINCDKVNEVNQKFYTELEKKCNRDDLSNFFTAFLAEKNRHVSEVVIPLKLEIKSEPKKTTTNSIETKNPELIQVETKTTTTTNEVKEVVNPTDSTNTEK